MNAWASRQLHPLFFLYEKGKIKKKETEREMSNGKGKGGGALTLNVHRACVENAWRKKS